MVGTTLAANIAARASRLPWLCSGSGWAGAEECVRPLHSLAECAAAEGNQEDRAFSARVGREETDHVVVVEGQS